MQSMERRSVGMYRVETDLLARLLPNAFAACGDVTVPVAELVLAAAVVGPAALRGRHFADVADTVRAIVGDDYAQGFVDGFGCASGQRGRGRRYVQGLDDAAALRDALRRLDTEWAWALLEHTQPRL